MSRVLLMQPAYPLARKSHFHKDFLPVGLLKLAAWRKAQGDSVKLTVGHVDAEALLFRPEEVYITSLFTYWSQSVAAAVAECRSAFPRAPITVGGIYASLQPEHCRSYTGCDEVFQGVHSEAEAVGPDYSLIDTDFQILHASRGCVRRCAFCGTYEIEPEYRPKRSIWPEVQKNKLVFYDNNLIANPHIKDLLGEVAEGRVNGRVVTCESQSGVDGRLLQKDPSLAQSLRQARFRNIRIAWDGHFSQHKRIEEHLRILIEAGFARKSLQVFMLTNHELSPEEVHAKVEQCYRWGVQVSDCRFRPLDLFEDGYQPQKKTQLDSEYYVHERWTDADVRGIRRMVRANNICVRYVIPRDRYVQQLESLSFRVKRSVAESLGITSKVFSDEELARINAAWLARHGVQEALWREGPESVQCDACA